MRELISSAFVFDLLLEARVSQDGVADRERLRASDTNEPDDEMEERHEREQYFFDATTVALLADFVATFERPCCLCAPMIGRELHRRGRTVRVLDVDERFADLPGFVAWDLYRPRHMDEEFDLVLCDPPFFNVSLSQLFATIRQLCHFDLTRRVMISYPVRRSGAILGTFAPFGLCPTGYHPGYQTVQKCEKNEIEFFANFNLSDRRLMVGG